MPGHFEFDHENKILLLVVEGEIDNAELLGANAQIAERVRRLQPVAGISDLSAVTSFRVSGEVMQSAARQSPPYPEHTPRFIVAPKDEIFGMARMYELVGSSTRPNLKVVRKRQEALAALSVANPKFEPLE